MAKIEVQVVFGIDTDEYVEPTPKFEEDPRNFVKGLVLSWDLPMDEDFEVFCPQLEPRRVAEYRYRRWRWQHGS